MTRPHEPRITNQGVYWSIHMAERYRIGVRVEDTVTGLVRECFNLPASETLVRYPTEVSQRILQPAFQAVMQSLAEEIQATGGQV